MDLRRWRTPTGASYGWWDLTCDFSASFVTLAPHRWEIATLLILDGNGDRPRRRPDLR